ncbi:MAG: hypothetical protein IT200_05630 [Thermoleophilia bacterium]|nr:hypothetical protein [Thermoleophilia bacterium]
MDPLHRDARDGGVCPAEAIGGFGHPDLTGVPLALAPAGAAAQGSGVERFAVRLAR